MSCWDSLRFTLNTGPFHGRGKAEPPSTEEFGEPKGEKTEEKKTEQEETKKSPAGFVPTSQLNGGRKIEREK